MNKQDAEAQSVSPEKCRRLFETYSRNLGAVKKHPWVHLEPDVEDVFLCPQCFCYFTREEVLAGENVEASVTLEHVPPKALGGRRLTLTCKKCNDWSGSDLDSHLINKLKSDEFLRRIPGAPVDAKLSLKNEINLTATAQYSEDRDLQIWCDEKRSDPKEVEKLRHLQESSPWPIKIDFRGYRGRGYKRRRPECSLLRIAYLWAFSVFGYGFLKNEDLSVIRQQINNPTEDVLPHWGNYQSKDFPIKV